jgi:hypothetical protein
MSIRLKTSIRCYEFVGKQHNYVIVYDTTSGRKDRYTIYRRLHASSRAEIVGRELDLPYCRKYIEELENGRRV